MRRSIPRYGLSGSRRRSALIKEAMAQEGHDESEGARMRGEPTPSPIGTLVEALASGTVEIVDLTQPLNERTPVIRLPEQFVDTPGLQRHEISRYDERGPAWAWYWLEIGEHVGTHFDAPIHWITGREGSDVSQVPPRHLVAPAGLPRRPLSSAWAWRPSASTLVWPPALTHLSRSTTTSSVRGNTVLRSSRTLLRCRRPARCSWWRR